MKPVRCAIYTRKSSDEGLEQTFNSLDAQREACAAYILSQASEGWSALPDVYDDGGLSGGTLERPALQRLLAEVAAGRIDIIVVYKVDRLTRSLLDFSKLVEAFDKAGTSFVSVTQSFNTTTSMGRLTLNMLLSFAQFEREVTAERIRDKIAASKARGMWMGGVAPLGYRPDGRSLAIVEDHAAVIRHIFDRYLALGNVRLLADELRARRIFMPVRVTGTGKTIGGRPFSRGLLYDTLRRVTYDGQIQHCDKVFVGNHPAIIDHDTFQRVQRLLSENSQGIRKGNRRPSGSVLAGRIVDGSGEPLIATHASKGTARYCYYVTRALQRKEADTGMRIPALEIERLVALQVAALFDDPLALADSAKLEIPIDRFEDVDARCARIAAELRSAPRANLQALVAQVTVSDASVTTDCDPVAIADALGLPCPAEPPPIRLTAHARVTRTGMAMRLVQDNGTGTAPADQSLIRLIAKGHTWWKELRRGELNITALAAREEVTASWLTRVVRLAFLAPDVTAAILGGTQRTGINLTALTQGVEIPTGWPEQRKMLLPASEIANRTGTC